MAYMVLQPRKSGKAKNVVITKDINVSTAEHTYISMDPLEAFCDEEGFLEVIFSCSCSCHFQINLRHAGTSLEFSKYTWEMLDLACVRDGGNSVNCLCPNTPALFQPLHPPTAPSLANNSLT